MGQEEGGSREEPPDSRQASGRPQSTHHTGRTSTLQPTVRTSTTPHTSQYLTPHTSHLTPHTTSELNAVPEDLPVFSSFLRNQNEENEIGGQELSRRIL